MDNIKVLDKTYHFITKRMVETGQALHYTMIAVASGFTNSSIF